MIYVEEIKIEKATTLLQECGLSLPTDVSYTVGVFDEDQLIATGSLKDDMIQGMAVSPLRQGEDLSAKVITALINYGLSHGYTSLQLFTKPDKATLFTSLGFQIVAIARPYATLLEWGNPGIKEYTQFLIGQRVLNAGDTVAAIVMNCNPFTFGHQYLIETAAKESSFVYVLVVEENLSQFSFKDRFSLVQCGTAHLPNVKVIPGGRYVVSSLTFPSYFTKDLELAQAHTAIDIEIFLRHIAPALGIKNRYIGEEPFSPVTNVYNETMKERLPKAGMVVRELPRMTIGSQIVSASLVRKLFEDRNFALIKALVPPSTYRYLEGLAFPSHLT